MPAVTRLTDRLRAFVAGEMDLPAGNAILEAVLEDGPPLEGLEPETRELMSQAALRLYRETDEGIPAIEYCSAVLLKLDLAGQTLDPMHRAVHSPLLHAYLTESLNTDLELEAHLVALRKRLLLEDRSAEHLDLITAFAHQCFHNEYLYTLDGEERERVAALAAELPVGAVPPETVALLGMYRAPLGFLSEKQATGLAAATHPDPLDTLITRTIREPLEERELASRLPSRAITDEVSGAVRTQYEAHPYPRWYRPRRGRGKQPRHDTGLPRHPRILVAGCGTGHQPIWVARRYSEAARIVALDLSVSSLAYGQRQARRFGCEHIEWRHGDLLDVPRMDEQYDLVYCSGVLHHLGDDVRQRGWNALSEVLAPRGLMCTHVYSVVARLLVAAIRDEVASRGLRPVPEDMLAYRSELIERLRAGTRGYGRLANTVDFYTLSGVRDLLFHVQEHRYRITELLDSATEAGLEFVGFELPPQLIARYHSQFPDDPGQTNLANWRRFEMHYAGSLSMLGATWRKR